MRQSIYCALAVALAGLLAGCSGDAAGEPVPAAADAEPMAVRVARAESRQVERFISVTGSLQPDETVTVSNEIAGMLAAVNVDFGQRVRRGEVVAELDKRELKLQLKRVQAALAQALARIGLTPEETDKIPKTTPAIRQAQAQLDNWRTKYESASRLVKTGDISHDRFVEIEKGYNAAEAALDGAHHELRVVLASIRSLRAEVQLARKKLGDATIRAPFDGAVAERLASPGEFLRQNTPIVKLVKTYPLRLRLDVPETAAAAVRVGTPLSFTTDALPGKSFTATVREVNPSLNAQSRTLMAEARLTRRQAELRPGMFVKVKLVIDRHTTIVVVPEQALRSVAGLNKVFAIESGKAIERKVIPGRRMDGWVEVRSEALHAGDTVAVSGLADLTDGDAVRTES